MCVGVGRCVCVCVCTCTCVCVHVCVCTCVGVTYDDGNGRWVESAHTHSNFVHFLFWYMLVQTEST